ncbi:MAG: hypothetical protein WAM10_03645, partial [Methylocella sp.]
PRKRKPAVARTFMVFYTPWANGFYPILGEAPVFSHPARPLAPGAPRSRIAALAPPAASP